MKNFASTLLINLIYDVYLPALILVGLAALPLAVVAVGVFWLYRGKMR
ncbi:MAG: hypothetical protein HN413_08145 [Chloroflexi bacterium]|nr:hypothetical protein [Chloroflexota bacterium]